MVGTDVEAVDRRPPPPQLRLQMPMQHGDVLQRIVAAGHPRLVGDDKDQEAGLLQPRNRRYRAGNESEVRHPEEVVLFDIDGAVAIEKDRGAGGGAVRFGAHGSDVPSSCYPFLPSRSPLATGRAFSP